MRFVRLANFLLAQALACSGSAFASTTLLPPEPRWVGGVPLTLEVLVREGAPPDKITLQIVDDQGRIRSLEAVRTQQAAEGGVVAYTATPHATETAQVRVSLAGSALAPYAVQLLAPPPGSGIAAAATVATAAPAESLPPPAQFTWLDAFFSHEPLYLLAGFAPEVDVKFQLSFKYQLYTPEPGLSKQLADGWVAPRGLYFTYTQTSLWDILKESSPFRDTSYKPGIYWQERDVWVRESEDDRWRFSIMAGLEHESNGRAEPASRSINVAVLRPTLGYVSPGGWRFRISPKISAFLEKTDNQDIDQYRGYVDLQAAVRAPSAHPEGGLQLSVIARKGTRGDNGSLQADLSYPARFMGLPGFLTLQAFAGEGETILDYNRSYDPQFRFGFSAIR